ncbi:MAG TPA: cupredoxin family copper-binding protein [Steroidobacteraceae bacterium]|nr:cupredoxin family copper-binding protein [Steroidobacteraceae bacterium]
MIDSSSHLRSRRLRRGGASTLASILAALLLVGVPSGGQAQRRAAAPAKTHLVIIQGLRYEPQTLVVRRGERIRWINKDPFPHTVTATKGAFDSHSIPADGSWTLVAGKAGTYDYACTFHPTMTGKLEVR